ncbi:MAG: hypothetical protein N3F07_02885 [Candidatus Micrarchaeota archaeon]|nr:hypothetical protein [Candidatus Micrarchaeota archaeon]
MTETKSNKLSLIQKPLPAIAERMVRKKEIQDYFEKNLRPLLSKMKDRVRKVARISYVFIRDKKLTRFDFAKVRE